MCLPKWQAVLDRRRFPDRSPRLRFAQHEAPRIDAGDANQSLPLKPTAQMIRGSIIGGIGDRCTQDQAACMTCAGFDVLVIGADIADMGKGEGDQLTGIGRIGKDFLIAGHRRIEDDFADDLALSPKALAFERRSVSQHERGIPIGIRLDRHDGVQPLSRVVLWGRAARIKAANRQTRGTLRVQDSSVKQCCGLA